MKAKISDILIVTDMDGTLLNSKCEISKADLETIRLFTMLGGKFTVATGRVVESIASYKELVPYISPAITSGGTVIYDYHNHTVVAGESLQYEVAGKILKDVLDNFPTVGSMVASTDGRVFKISPSKEMHGLFEDEKLSYFMRPYEELPKEWNKILFAGPQEQLEAIQEFLDKQFYHNTNFVMTSPVYYEVMPKGINKGTALLKLCEKMNIKIENTYVIGDYYNDVEMMATAGCAVAMDNAPQDIKNIADHITANNNQAGVGQFIYKVIKEHYNN